MSKHDDDLTELFDKNGNLIGALLTADLWAKVKPMVKDLLPQEAPPERPEPIGEWETLKEYWDFPYPVDTDVHCELAVTKLKTGKRMIPASSGLCPATSVDLFHLNAPSAMPALSKSTSKMKSPSNVQPTLKKRIRTLKLAINRFTKPAQSKADRNVGRLM